MKKLIQKILELEWDMFVKVQNIGGPADCQNDPHTFYKQRGSQFAAWNDAMLKSYLDDLQTAKRFGRNLLAEKYAYMMKNTVPDEYNHIFQTLPSINVEKKALINKIIKIHLRWAQETALLYPGLSGRSRPIYSNQDTYKSTSYETYFHGELATYSDTTLNEYYCYAQKLDENGENLNLIILEHTVKSYDYPSLEAAERAACLK